MSDVTSQKSVDSSLPIEDRIKFLKHCCKLYEVGDSPISDVEYDKEYYSVCEWLEQNDPDHEFLDEVGGEHIYGTKVKHAVIMGSLNKSLDIDQFLDWFRKTYGEHPNNLAFQFQHKVDGLSLGCIYENGELVRAVTRGDGSEGTDVTANALFVSGVPKTIPYKGIVEVRGECYKDRQDFYKNWHTSVGGGFANPRNFAAGAMNQKDPQVTKSRGVSFVAYEIVQKEFKTEREKTFFLEENGFLSLRSSTRWTKSGLSAEQIARAAKSYMDSIDRKNLPYDIDGVVFKVDDIKYGSAMGFVSNGRKAKSSRAIKFPAEESIPSPILDVEARVGRTGVICPVAIITPVELGGAMISRVSLHNYGMLANSDIRIGSKVVVAKKGDIIPQIVRVHSVGPDPIKFPTNCPSCNEKLEWSSTRVHLICNNYNCIAQLNAKIDNWFKKIGVKGIGIGIISRLTDSEQLSWEGKPIISSLQEMYYMLDNDRRSEHPFRKYNYLKERLGEKTYENILDSIKSVKEVPLHTFIEALGIAKIGSMAKDIVDIAPSVEDIDHLTVSQIESIDRFGSVKAENFVNGWKEARSEIRILLRYIKAEVKQASSNVLAGKKFCFTGSFSIGRSQLEAMVVDNGGKCGSVGKDTILVWDESENGNKLQKAKQNGNTIINEKQFFAMLT